MSRSKHTPFRLALELARLERRAADWLEAYLVRNNVDEIDAHIQEISRRTRRTERYLRDKEQRAA